MDFCGLLRMSENMSAGSPWDEGGDGESGVFRGRFATV